jgi:beta-glucosidase/6-phospho-beta-glucosidase/beta-galactosidase
VVRTFPAFAVACGEEASDPTVLHEGAVVRVDELAASDHLARQNEDLAAVAGLGVRWWRYGMPWRLTEVEPGVYDWSLWDRALSACERHGLEPIVDLCHFGLPDHLAGFCDQAWVDAFVRYVDAFLVRYSEPTFFTPVNEPGITAQLSAGWGIWNDRRATPADHANALALVTLANLEAIARVDADRQGWWIGSEGFGVHVAAGPEDEHAVAEARALEQLVWDLHLGIEPDPSVADRVTTIEPSVLRRIDAVPLRTDRVVAGHDLYPVSVQLHGARDDPLTIDERVAAYEDEARRWHARYGRAFWVSETSNLGLPVADGPRWLDALVAALDGLAADGLPVRGICWYSRGDQYDWHTALTRPVGEVTEVGLFDADRRPRPVADLYAALARARDVAAG